MRIHNSEYKSIVIAEDRLDWMNGQEEAHMKGDENLVNLRDRKTRKDQLPVLSKVQCIGDVDANHELEFAAMSLNEDQFGINPEQAQLMKELVDTTTKETDQTDKLLHFPPHGDTPIK